VSAVLILVGSLTIGQQRAVAVESTVTATGTVPLVDGGTAGAQITLICDTVSTVPAEADGTFGVTLEAEPDSLCEISLEARPGGNLPGGGGYIEMTRMVQFVAGQAVVDFEYPEAKIVTVFETDGVTPVTSGTVSVQVDEYLGNSGGLVYIRSGFSWNYVNGPAPAVPLYGADEIRYRLSDGSYTVQKTSCRYQGDSCRNTFAAITGGVDSIRLVLPRIGEVEVRGEVTPWQGQVDDVFAEVTCTDDDSRSAVDASNEFALSFVTIIGRPCEATLTMDTYTAERNWFLEVFRSVVFDDLDEAAGRADFAIPEPFTITVSDGTQPIEAGDINFSVEYADADVEQPDGQNGTATISGGFELDGNPVIVPMPRSFSVRFVVDTPVGYGQFFVDATSLNSLSIVCASGVCAPAASGPIDANGDGIEDEIAGPEAGSFNDGTTFGSIVSVPDGLVVQVVDAEAPDGVQVTVTGDPSNVEWVRVSVCGFTVQLSVGSVVVFTCGSLTTRVIAGGPVVIELEGGASVSASTGTVVVVDGETDGGYTVENQSGQVSITVDGLTSTVAPGTSSPLQVWHFSGFSSPVDNPPTLNTVKAGRAVPLKWRLTDADGNPVTTLASARVSFVRDGCTNAPADEIEQSVTGSSGLQNLGNGYYQLNWKTPSAAGCGQLRLDIGQGVDRTASFKLR
jgi:hypothetical protein